MFVLQVVNHANFRRALDLAPTMVVGALRRVFKRAGNKFRVKAVNALLTGPPGINIPRRSGRGRRREFKRTSKKAAPFRHIIAKSGGKENVFLAAYTSKFLTYHDRKIRSRFKSLFEKEIPAIERDIKKETVRITQVVLDRELSRNIAAFTRGAGFARGAGFVRGAF